MVSYKTRHNLKKFVAWWRLMALKVALLAIFIMGFTSEPSSKQLCPTRKQAAHPSAAAAAANVEGMT